MTSQPHVLDTMDISTKIMTDNTIDIPLFVENVETSNEPTDSPSNQSNPTMAAKNKNEWTNEKKSINLHSTYNKNADTIKRTKKHGV